MRAKCSFAAGAAAVALCFAGAVLAQSGPAPAAHSQVVMVHVKADMLNEWMDLQKNEFIPAQKKAGVTTRTTYQTVFGNTNEFLTVTPLNKYAEFDGQSQLEHALGTVGAARLAAKLQECLESREVFISNALPELSSAPAGPSARVMGLPTSISAILFSQEIWTTSLGLAPSPRRLTVMPTSAFL